MLKITFTHNDNRLEVAVSRTTMAVILQWLMSGLRADSPQLLAIRRFHDEVIR